MAQEIGTRIAVLASSAAGTGSVSLGAAISDLYLTFAEANISDGATVPYTIEDGTDFESGVGTYNSAGPTLDRDTVKHSKVDGTAGTAKLDLSANAVIRLTPLGEDYGKLTHLSVTQAVDLDAMESKVDGIEAAADVTDAVNVAAAGALMESGENQGPITGGAEIDPKDHGTQSTGTLAVDVADCPFQEVINGGPFGLEVGPAYGWTVLDINNNGSAGVITTTTIDKVTGDDFDTTNGNWFRCSLVNGPGGSSLHVQAMQ